MMHYAIINYNILQYVTLFHTQLLYDSNILYYVSIKLTIPCMASLYPIQRFCNTSVQYALTNMHTIPQADWLYDTIKRYALLRHSMLSYVIVFYIIIRYITILYLIYYTIHTLLDMLYFNTVWISTVQYTILYYYRLCTLIPTRLCILNNYSMLCYTQL